MNSSLSTFIICVLLQFFSFCGYAQTTGTCDDSCAEFFVPNVLTINSDGKNDTFQVSLKNEACLCEVKILEVAIYDRWGCLVICRTNLELQDPWNGGTEKGNELPSGEYTELKSRYRAFLSKNQSNSYSGDKLYPFYSHS